MVRHSLLEQRNQIDTRAWLEEQVVHVQPARQLDLPLLCEMNARLLRGLDLGEQRAGVPRTIPLAVRCLRYGIRYPPPPEEVPALLTAHVQWLHSPKAGQLTAIARAVRVATAISDIHPFVDGNGRTARLAAAAILLGAGYRYGKEVTLEEYLESRRRTWRVGVALAINGEPAILRDLFEAAVSALMHVSSS